MKINIAEAKIFLKDLLNAQKPIKRTAKKAQENLIRISDKFTQEEYHHIIGFDTTLEERGIISLEKKSHPSAPPSYDEEALRLSNWSLIDNQTKKLGIPFIVEKTPEGNAIMNFGCNTMFVDFWHMTPEEMNGRVKLLMENPYKK